MENTYTIPRTIKAGGLDLMDKDPLVEYKRAFNLLNLLNKLNNLITILFNLQIVDQSNNSDPASDKFKDIAKKGRKKWSMHL